MSVGGDNSVQGGTLAVVGADPMVCKHVKYLSSMEEDIMRSKHVGKTVNKLCPFMFNELTEESIEIRFRVNQNLVAQENRNIHIVPINQIFLPDLLMNINSPINHI